MGKVLVFIYEQMADFEVTFLTHLLGADAGKEIIPISNDDKCIRSKSGLVYQALMFVKDVTLSDDIEGLIIPGGWNGEVRNELVALIQALHNQNKLLAAICAGPRFLAKAGVLEHLNYTTSITNWTQMHKDTFNEEDPFPRAHFLDQRLVVDQHIITAKGIAFIDFAIAVCDWFKLFESVEDKMTFTKSILGT